LWWRNGNLKVDVMNSGIKLTRYPLLGCGPFHVDNIALPFIVDRKKLNLISERCVRRESGILFSLIVGEVRTDSHRPDLTDCHAREGVSDRGVSETLANS